MTTTPEVTASLLARCTHPFPGSQARYASLPLLGEQGFARIDRLPVVLRVILESLLRHAGSVHVSEADVAALAGWQPNAPRVAEIPFVVGRVVLQDIGGIPLLGDFAAMRDAMAARGGDPVRVRPRVPVAMVIDHSLAVERHASPDALVFNMQSEAEQNHERFAFTKWAVAAIEGIRVVPPGLGILHQVNLEHFADGLLTDGSFVYPDTLVGTDSHTGMIAGLGVVGWGCGGIEVGAAMLGQPVPILTPDVVAVDLHGTLHAGVTATDIVLHLTHRLREAGVVGKFVEFTGAGVAALSVPDRATIANMAPEYGATIGFFAFDAQTERYLLATGRDAKVVADLKRYWQLQGCGQPPSVDSIDYSAVIRIDLAEVEACLAGPSRPQQLNTLSSVRDSFERSLLATTDEGGYGKQASRLHPHGEARRHDRLLRDGDIVIASITSCTNTSNPDVMLQAGLLARNAVARGMTVPPWVKTSLAPGSLVVSRYLDSSGLQEPLDRLGFAVVGYGCATCVGNSGPLIDGIEATIAERSLTCCAVLSGNRNFEGRVHPSVDAAYLMSPPLIVAYALAGSMRVDLSREPLGHDANGAPVVLKDLWPSEQQLSEARLAAARPDFYVETYGPGFEARNQRWNAIEHQHGQRFDWDARSSYIRPPRFLSDPALLQDSLVDITDARILALFGDSVTTDHISPAGNIAKQSPAGAYLQQLGVTPSEFNSYGARRMNADVMTRGTFANRLIRNRMVEGTQGGITRHWPGGDEVSIFEASQRYQAAGVPLVVFAGKDYGMGSARDWAAKGTRLLGVRAVVAQGFERIHRSNLVRMGVLPCQLPEGVTIESLALTGDETISLVGIAGAAPRATVELRIVRRGETDAETFAVMLRVDTPSEIEYVKRGGILPYMLETL